MIENNGVYSLGAFGYIIVMVASYLIGSINNAIILAHIKGVDLRASGSGNPGTMNVTRTMGEKWGWVVLLLDVAKSVIPCSVGWYLLGDEIGFLGNDKIGLFFAGVFVIIGHIFPLYYKFKGGKGIASTIGIMLLATPFVTLVSFAIGLTFVKITRIGSITSFIVIGFPIVYEAFYQRLHYGNLAIPALLFCLFVITLLTHHKNIAKLFKYTEKPVLKRKVKSQIPPQKTT